MRKHQVRFQSEIKSLYEEKDIIEQMILWVFASSQMLWPLLFENFLNNFSIFLMKIFLPHTYRTKKRYVKFQVHIFTHHEEMLGLVTDTLFLKPTVSAIICEKTTPNFYIFLNNFHSFQYLKN